MAGLLIGRRTRSTCARAVGSSKTLAPGLDAPLCRRCLLWQTTQTTQTQTRHRHDQDTARQCQASKMPREVASRVSKGNNATVSRGDQTLPHTHTGQHEDSVRPESSRLQLSCDIRHHVFDTGVHAVVHPPGIVLAAEVMSISSGSSSCCFGGGQSNQQRIFG